jgi:hypothetical protein
MSKELQSIEKLSKLVFTQQDQIELMQKAFIALQKQVEELLNNMIKLAGRK